MVEIFFWAVHGITLCMGVPLAVGVYFAFKTARGPRERAFVLRFVIAMNLVSLLFLAMLFLGFWLLPGRWGFLSWVIYPPFVLVPAWIGSRRHTRIRAEEAKGLAAKLVPGGASTPAK